MNSTDKKKPTLHEWHPLITDKNPIEDKPPTKEESDAIVKRANERLAQIQRQ
jgi:hypothetical protein